MDRVTGERGTQAALQTSTRRGAIRYHPGSPTLPPPTALTGELEKKEGGKEGKEVRMYGCKRRGGMSRCTKSNIDVRKSKGEGQARK